MERRVCFRSDLSKRPEMMTMTMTTTTTTMIEELPIYVLLQYSKSESKKKQKNRIQTIFLVVFNKSQPFYSPSTRQLSKGRG